MSDVIQREQPPGNEVEADHQTVPGKGRGRAGRLFRRCWGSVVFACRWLCRPDHVGQPITLQPRGVRLLVLLIAGNLLVMVLLIVSLFRTATLVAGVLPPRLVVATPTPGPSPTPGFAPAHLESGGAIALTLERNGNSDVYALNQADRELVRLTYDAAEDRDATWSPDGNQIAFASKRADNWDIYLLDLMSGSLIRLTRDPAFDGNPSWSPDGRYIAFESYRNGSLDVFTMTPDGKQMWRITTGFGPDCEPAWSPDSSTIAFSSFRNGNRDIYVRLLDGSTGTRNVTNSPGADETHPAWSPDGTRLAYVSNSGGRSSIQVSTFTWDTPADDAGTQLLGAGASPIWTPDGRNLVYAVHDSEGRSHLIAASMTGWAQSQEVYGTDGRMDDLAWTEFDLSPRIVARARAADPGPLPPVYAEMVQPTPAAGPPYRLIPLANVSQEDADPLLSDRVDDSFDALRRRTAAEMGWDYLARLSSSWVPLTYTPPSGHSRQSWHVCGRAIGLDREQVENGEPGIELVREDVGSITYWRIFARTARQDGSQGEPLRVPVWDLNARTEGGRAGVEGGALKRTIPAGYYVDLSDLAESYGWERASAMWRWRYSLPDVRWWELVKTGDLTWWDCMLEVFPPDEIVESFGPIPGHDE